MMLVGALPVKAGTLTAGGDHSGENHTNEDHSDQVLPNINLTDANIYQSNFSGTDFTGATFSLANMFVMAAVTPSGSSSRAGIWSNPLAYYYRLFARGEFRLDAVEVPERVYRYHGLVDDDGSRSVAHQIALLE